jgi:succinyl-CoA synthetase alpha subunit
MDCFVASLLAMTGSIAQSLRYSVRRLSYFTGLSLPWPEKHRPAYTYDDLRRLIDPRSVAVVGLSRNEASFGARTAKNLAFFEGRVFGVNPKADSLYGILCFSSIGALPESVDCAVLAVPVEAVEGLVEECAAAGIGGCIIYASGFAETGRPERQALQARLTAIARGSGLRIVGPNCIGLINNVSKAGLSFSSSYAVRLPRTGDIGIASQSGGLGQAIAQAAERGGAYSHYMAAGNSCDVDVCDYVSYLAGDPSCRVITCIAEGLADGERLLEAGERALAADKPIVMYKIATGAAAARAAMSHTGTLASSRSIISRMSTKPRVFWPRPAGRRPKASRWSPPPAGPASSRWTRRRLSASACRRPRRQRKPCWTPMCRISARPITRATSPPRWRRTRHPTPPAPRRCWRTQAMARWW